MCETGHNNLTFITVDQKIPWEYLEASAQILKTAYFKHFEHFPAIENLKKTNFAANHCEYE